ncbi:MAG TPA: AMP-binding protein, partial [Isosphaeraceae bacterium]|nr:AMP-binding protein [Isosphaeraceae bacterium]
AVANVALTLQGIIPVNLNYTASQEIIDSSIDQCKITHVVTSRRVLDKFKVKPKGNLIFLEDLPKAVSKADKVAAGVAGKVLPKALLGVVLPGLRASRLDVPASVIFTSGSTGQPKGVVLTHRNVLSNIHQIQQRVDLNEEEVVLGILPFFHSFGFTITIWTILSLGFKAVYHFSPLDSRIIGNLCQEHSATILFATPTFMRGMVLRCEREQFASMRLPILGAEKLKPELAKQIREGLGIEPLEGYGCTETGPVVAVNVPQEVTRPNGSKVHANRPGTVGLPLPGTSIKTVDPDSGEDLPRGADGLIHVRGPQVMPGYWNRPEETAKVLRDGWYNTGDLGALDEDGFLRITDRLSRFSKIGGEMVPHQGVEAAIVEVSGKDDQHVAVTSLPDPKRGERLVVLYTDLGDSPESICRRLAGLSLPKLWLPGPGDFIQVESLPVLGTGKLDLRQMRVIAKERLDTGSPTDSGKEQ